jgi:hypothetical protein
MAGFRIVDRSSRIARFRALRTWFEFDLESHKGFVKLQASLPEVL